MKGQHAAHSCGLQRRACQTKLVHVRLNFMCMFLLRYNYRLPQLMVFDASGNRIQKVDDAIGHLSLLKVRTQLLANGGMGEWRWGAWGTTGVAEQVGLLGWRPDLGTAFFPGPARIPTNAWVITVRAAAQELDVSGNEITTLPESLSTLPKLEVS